MGKNWLPRRMAGRVEEGEEGEGED